LQKCSFFYCYNLFMPVTPFHLLAIIPLKAIAPHRFSWSVFALANVIIDLEPITYYLITLYPSHRLFHTIIGATLIAMLCATYGRRLCELGIKALHGELQDKEVKWLGEASIGNTAAWSGALIGAWSHLLLDSFMHEDIKPFSPFTDANPLLGVVSVSNLNALCVVSGLLGVVVLLKKRKRD
jgi:membrane-bound metal-dependent hydrolase YbcI (DUF457 family)